MLFNNKTITAAISHNFLVDPDRRHSMAGIQLASRFLSGPQDFSLAEGNDISRRIWERFDGTVSLLYSLAWLRPIQPSRYLLSYLVRRGLPRAVTLLLRPLCSLGDKLLSRFLDKNAQPDTDNLEKSELEPAQLQECLLEMLESRKIRPLGDQSALAWQLAALNQSSGESQLFKILVRDTNDEPIGWYLYFFRPGGVSDVLQIGARPGLENQVLDHLFNHAKNHGVIALSGQLDPTLFTELSRKQCLFRNDGHSWMLFHTRHPDISQALQQGDAFISRMDGEWWINALNA